MGMTDGHGHGGHRHGGDVPRDRHGNPEDLERYLAKLEDPERLAWQKPDEVVAALGLRPGDVACDVGVGPGYFALRIARAVGPSGRVHAIDVEPRMLEILARRVADAGLANVTPLLAAVDFHAGELPVGPPPDHKVSREGFLDAAGAAGLEVVREERFLPHQWFFLVAPRR